eukprot:scaffold48360_cov60-Phaeocystis_antarctica.AAC.6
MLVMLQCGGIRGPAKVRKLDARPRALSTAKSTQSAAGLGHPSLSMVVSSSLSMAWCIVPPTSTTAANMIKYGR